MASNSKLTPNQKICLKTVLRPMQARKGIRLARNETTTMAFMERGNTVEFSLSVASPDEMKFRRKVGDFWALTRFDCGETVKMGKEDFAILQDGMCLWE